MRDGRAPIPECDATSKVMSSNKGKDTGPELILRRALRENGLAGYRLHWKKVPGRPDLAYPGRRIAIFVHGCFWHRCPHCDLPLPKSNLQFWSNKFDKNRKKDACDVKQLKKIGWLTIIIWECELNTNLVGVIKKIKEIYKLQS